MRDTYIKSKAGLLPIGRRGENLATRVIYPGVPEEGQTVTVFVKRNGDTAAYPASNTEVTDTEIIWTVTSVDTGKQGRGQVQYRYTNATTGEVIKTDIYGFMVGMAIDADPGPAPDPYETWLDSLTDLAGQVQVAAQAAESEAARAETYAEQAETSAQNAEQSASSAGESAGIVQMAIPIFEQIAQRTAASADAAGNSEIQAQVARERAVTAQMEAESAARQASASAESASSSKTDAETARQQAYRWAQSSQTYSEAASASAGRASQSATAAGQSEQAASASATSASQSAGTATAKAAEASASATTAATKASEASASATAAQEAQTGAETAQAGAESAAQTAQAGADAVGLLREQIYNSYPGVEAEAGSIVSISDGADGIPVKSLVVGIEPVQAGSGDPSPDNVRPITGWTGCEVVRTGKNLLDVDRYGSRLPRTAAGVTWSKVRDGVYHAQGTATGNSFFDISFTSEQDAMPCDSFAGKRLFLSVTDSQIGARLSYFREDGTFPPTPNGSIVPNDAVGLRAYVRVEQNTVIDADFSIQLEIGSTATAYEPYQDQGDTYPITFPTEAGTVYGGSLDVTSGVLTVDRVMADMETIAWYKTSSTSSVGGSVFVVRASTIGMATRERYAPNTMLSSAFATAPDSRWFVDQMLDNEMFSDQTSLYVSASQYDTIADFKSAMSGVQLCYELATPQTYQLTPTEVKTLLGSNNIWADTGDVQEMAYRADPKLYIDGVYKEYQDDLADYAGALAALG